METIRAKINGKEPLSQKIEKTHTMPIPLNSIKITQSKVESTFNYMDKLSNFLPDKSISSAMKSKIQYILENMRNKNG